MRTFRHEDFDPRHLLDLKGEARVSLVIPARDEEATVGGIVARLRAELLEAVPLIDELIVIDSDSRDRTAERAEEAGAQVFAAQDIRPDVGRAQGKGEALWKSQFVATGDVLVFVDSDLIEWGPHFVTGLLGPLLTDPHLQLVKALYHRPLLDASGHEVESGGRVTELVARPLLALHWPALADVIQPLSGEWAIRREAFASYSVPVGYGVEIAALLDTADRFGEQAIAQVDLGRRAHRHHRHDTLGPMAVQVMAAAERRRGVAPESEQLTLRQFDAVTTTQPQAAAESSAPRFAARERTVDLRERPAAGSLR